VKTDGSGMYPFPELRPFNADDNSEFSEFVSHCEVKNVQKIDLKLS